jgi:hypothetical protein
MWAMNIKCDILAGQSVILARLDPVTCLADKAKGRKQESIPVPYWNGYAGARQLMLSQTRVI